MNNKGYRNFGWANNSATKTQDTNTFTVGTGSDESTCTVKDGSIAEVVLSGRTATNLLGTDGFAERTFAVGESNYFAELISSPASTYFIFANITAGCTTSVRNTFRLTYSDDSKAYQSTSENYNSGVTGRIGWKVEMVKTLKELAYWVNDPDTEVKVKEFGIVEITSDEYTNLSVADLLAKYPYFSDTKFLTNPTVTSKNSDGDTVDTVSYSGTVASGATVKLRPRVRTGGSIVVADDIGYGGLTTSTKYHTCKNQGFKNV